MRLKVGILFFVTSVVIGNFAFADADADADADDETWINQCAADNKNVDVPAAVVKKYCKCMNNKMSNDEMQSITAWEQSHPDEAKACVKYAIAQ